MISHFIRSGIEWLGEPCEIEGQQEAALWVPTEQIRPLVHCKKYGIEENVLSLNAVEQERVAA